MGAALEEATVAAFGGCDGEVRGRGRDGEGGFFCGRRGFRFFLVEEGAQEGGRLVEHEACCAAGVSRGGGGGGEGAFFEAELAADAAVEAFGGESVGV